LRNHFDFSDDRFVGNDCRGNSFFNWCLSFFSRSDRVFDWSSSFFFRRGCGFLSRDDNFLHWCSNFLNRDSGFFDWGLDGDDGSFFSSMELKVSGRWG
jgi:hypothetical protein